MRIAGVRSGADPTECSSSPQLAIRPGTDWSSLAAFIATGTLQLVLLILCFVWKQRQKRLGIDDFGRPLASHPPESAPGSSDSSVRIG